MKVHNPAVSNPLHQLQSWSKNRASCPQKDYGDAMAAFEKDSLFLQGQDNGGADTDLRPGRVSSASGSHLQPTDGGFDLRVREAGVEGGGFMAPAFTNDGASRSYAVDSATGTITVLNDIGARSAGGGFGQFPGFSTSAYTETYTIDTVNGTIADYAKNSRATSVEEQQSRHRLNPLGLLGV